MAKLHEEVVVIKVSKLIKDDATTPILLTNPTLESLEAVVAELVGSNTLVEVQVA
jgi:hypothetical protein